MIQKKGIELLRQLKGEKYLAIGNHDTDARLQTYATAGIFKDIQYGYRIKASKRKIFLLTHYITLVKNETNDGMFNIHGHTHSNNKFTTDKNYCVCTEAVNNKPISIEEVLSDLNIYKENK